MSKVKYNQVAAERVLQIWLQFEKKCCKCGVELAFDNEYQLDHFVPQEFFKANGLKLDHSTANMTVLCKSCNSAKGVKMPTEFFTDTEIKLIREMQALKIDKKVSAIIGREIAKNNPTGKFAKTWKCGQYHVKA